MWFYLDTSLQKNNFQQEQYIFSSVLLIFEAPYEDATNADNLIYIA